MQLVTLYHSHQFGYTMYPFWVPIGTTFDEIDQDKIIVLLGIDFDENKGEFIDISLCESKPEEIPSFTAEQFNFERPTEWDKEESVKGTAPDAGNPPDSGSRADPE